MEFIFSNLPKLVNSLGLICDVVGAVLITWYGLPEPISRIGGINIAYGVNENEIAKAKKYDFRSKVGLWLLIGGFFLQLVSNFILSGK